MCFYSEHVGYKFYIYTITSKIKMCSCHAISVILYKKQKYYVILFSIFQIPKSAIVTVPVLSMDASKHTQP